MLCPHGALSSWCSFLMVLFHEGALPSVGSFVMVVFHHPGVSPQGGQSSFSLSSARFFHQGGL